MLIALTVHAGCNGLTPFIFECFTSYVYIVFLFVIRDSDSSPVKVESAESVDLSAIEAERSVSEQQLEDVSIPFAFCVI